MLTTKSSTWIRRAAVAPLALASLVGLAACSDDSPPTASLGAPAGALSVAVTNSSALLVQANLGQLWELQVRGQQVDVRQSRLPDDVVATQVTADRIFALSQSPPTLTVLGEQGLEASYALPSSYDKLTLSEDGRFAIAWYGPDSTGGPGTVLFNANEVTVVDRQAAGGGVQTFSLNGLRTNRMQVLAPFSLGGEEVYYAMAIGRAEVALVKLTATDSANRQRLVPLADPSFQTSYRLDDVFCPPQAANAVDHRCFLLATGARDVFAIDLVPGADAGGRELQPSVNLIGLYGPAASMTPFQVDGAWKLLVTSESTTDAAIVDARNTTADRLLLPQALTRVSSWTDDADNIPRALLWRPGLTVLYFAELPALVEQGGAALRARQLRDRVGTVSLVLEDGTNKAVVAYQGGGGLGVVDLVRRTETPIPATTQIVSQVIYGDLWVGVPANLPTLATVNLQTEAVGAFDLPAVATALHVIPEAGWLLVRHDDMSGWMTLFDLARLEDGPQAELRGLFFTGLLDR